MITQHRLLVPCLIALCAAASQAQPRKDAQVVELRRIWDAAPHNAFTDLIRYDNRFFCVFREGQSHASPDGALRVISSVDTTNWTSVAQLTAKDGDLRDPKLALASDDRLMLTAAKASPNGASPSHQSLVWFSSDGAKWTGPQSIGDPDFWLWRVTWHSRVAYAIGYHTKADTLRLYRSKRGRSFDVVADKIFPGGAASESTLLFLKDDAVLALVRRDGEKSSAQLGLAIEPYKHWEWKDLGLRLGGPNMISLPDGRIVVGARTYDGGERTALLWLDPEAGKLTEFLKLPSAGDCSYPGLVWHNGFLWVSYYSSHEDKTCIYLAKVEIGNTTSSVTR